MRGAGAQEGNRQGPLAEIQDQGQGQGQRHSQKPHTTNGALCGPPGLSATCHRCDAGAQEGCLDVEAVAAFGEAEEGLPEEAVDGDDHGGHDDGGEQKQAGVAAIVGETDLGSEAERGVGVLIHAEVFGDDAGVPCASGGGDESGDEVGEDSGEDDGHPALAEIEAEDAGDIAHVAGDGERSGDDVEEDVPLGSEKHEDDGGRVDASARLNDGEKDDGEERSCRDGGGDLRERLRVASEAGMEADGDSGGDASGDGEEQREGDAEERGSGGVEGER